VNILIIGSGGREHALAWKIRQSPKIDKLFIAPGNAGTAQCGTNIEINPLDFKAVKRTVLENDIHMVVVGPEVPLVEGIHDYFLSDEQLKNVSVIGPVRKGAQLEGSKDFAKEFMAKHKIPTAKYFSVNQDNIAEGIQFMKKLKPPYVLKADGLAAGKGVLIIDDLKTAETTLREMIGGMFGIASKIVLIEEFLKGIECSVFVITDGIDYRILPEAKDYKRIGEGDTGLNTGGMGAVSPVPFADKVFMKKVENQIIMPTINGLRRDEIPFKGFIFFGLINVDGEPYVIEYNVRLGDPETEAVILRIKSDLVDLLEGVANGDLAGKTIEIDSRSSVTVMLVSDGYPGNYEKGKAISETEKIAGSIVFHAGTKMLDGKVVTNGGRVLSVSSVGRNFREALDISYKNIKKIQFENMYYRNDIGYDL
jgi:phosphoribosylamine---glycine ligase